MRQVSIYGLLYMTVLMITLAISNLVVGQESGDAGVTLKVAAVCMNAKSDTAANLGTFTAYIREASEKGVHLIVFPEIALQQNPGWGASSYVPTGVELAYVQDTAETIPGTSTDALVQIARENHISVVFGMTEISPTGDLYNASVFLGPGGIFGKYRKRQLWDSGTGGNEHRFWLRGSESGLVESPLGKVGLVICIEMTGQFGQELADAGADFLVTVSAWPGFGGSAYENQTKSNATQTGLWHVVANQVGMVGHATDYGHSRIINPDGIVVADTGAAEGMVIAETDVMLRVRSADFNGNGTIDIRDLLQLIESWGENDPEHDIAPAPFGDGVVGEADLEVLMHDWGCAVSDATLAAHWAFDETQGDIAYDGVASNDAVLVGDPVWQPDGGMVAGALQLDGTDDCVSADLVLNPADGAFSVFAWIKGGAPGQVIISQESCMNWLMADLANGAVRTDLRSPATTGRGALPAGPPLVSTTIITDGDWHRVGFVRDGISRILYVDDVEVAGDMAPSLESANGGLCIGAGGGLQPGTFWSGLIDDVRIYNRAVKP